MSLGITLKYIFVKTYKSINITNTYDSLLVLQMSSLSSGRAASTDIPDPL